MVQMSMEEEPQEGLISLSVLSQMLSGETLSPAPRDERLLLDCVMSQGIVAETASIGSVTE